MNRNVLGIVFALTLWGGVVLANDPIQDNSPHTLGQHSCQVTSSVLYYEGTNNIYPADIFDGSTNVHWRISVVPNDSWYSIYNNGLFNAPGFQFGSNGKPINQGPIIAVASTSPGSIGTSIPSGYTRAQIASQIVYRLKRRSYAAGPFPNPIYYTPVGGSTQNTTINTSPNASSTEQDNECRNMYVGFCGDSVVDNGTQSSFEGTPAQFANYALAGGEACDDGNTNNNDACKNDCTRNAPACGTVNGQTYYDDQEPPLGDEINVNTPNLCPAGQTPTNFLYNATLDQWTWNCRYNVPGAPQSSQCIAYEDHCGDGTVNGTPTNPEACDDGNQNNNDACNNLCQQNPGVCGRANGQTYYDDQEPPLGDEINPSSPNLCPTGQQVVAGSFQYANGQRTWKCERPGGPDGPLCTANEDYCGDGVVNGTPTNPEACDDGNQNNNDACNNSCQIPAGVCGAVNGQTYYDDQEPPLGDEINANTPNLCPTGQQVVAGSFQYANGQRTWKCERPGGPDGPLCTANEDYCGDGVVNGTPTNPEACDDGNQNNNDSCNNSCQIPVGVCGGANGQTYYDDAHPPLGDEINASSPNLCPVGQQVVAGSFQYANGQWTWNCERPGGPDGPLCTANEDYCGDGTLNGTQSNPETCDDGNNVSNDGCSATCVIETPGCGFANGQTYYGIFPGVSLDETSPDLCPTGQVVVPGSFAYNSPNYTWECDFPTGDNPVSCGALDSRCGDGVIGTGIGYAQFGNEQCDENGDNGVACTPGYGGTCTYCSLNCQEITLTGGFCGDTLFQNPPEECDLTSAQNTCANGLTCTSECTCEDMTLGSCGFANGKTYYAFGNNGAALNANSPDLCPTGQTVTPGSFDFAGGVFSWSCDGPGGTGPTCYAEESRCGDGEIGTGINYIPGQEQCDEGANNGVPCTPGYGQTCTYCTTMCVEEEVVGPYCGDGIIQPGEQCDDGGIVNGDGCNQFCQIESPGACGGAYSGQYLYDANNSGDSISINTPGLCVGGVPTTFSYNPTAHSWTWTCPGSNGGNPVSCQAWELRCGNNDVDGNEECDGSSNTCGSGEICNQNSCQCVVEGNPECGYLLNVDQGYDFNGDNAGEEIDINTQVLCLEGTPVGFNYSPFARERRWHCVENGIYSNQCYFTAQRCGNGLVEDFLGVNNPEECDGGNGNTDIEHCDENELCISCECIPQAPVCGNGIVEAGEECDDGNGSNSDTCTNECEPTVCGDGITQSPNGMGQNEACDDGNQDNNDSCSNTCTVNEPSECTYLSVNYTPGDLPWIVPYNCVGNGNDVTVVLYNGQGVPIQTGYTAQGVFQLNSVDTYQIVCSYDGVTSPACQQTIEVGGYCEDLVAQGSGQTYTFSCDGVGSDFEIVITDAQGNIVTTASSGSSFQYTYTFTQPGTYTAICYVDGQTGRSCPDSGGTTTGGPTVTTIPLPTGGTNTGGPTVTTIPLPTGGTLVPTPTPTTVLPTEGTNTGGPTVTTVSPTNGGSTTTDSVPIVPVKPVDSTETHTHTHGSASVGTVGTASPTPTTAVPTATLGTETTKGKEATSTTITVVEKFKTQSVVLDKNTAIIDKNGDTVVVPAKGGTLGTSLSTTFVGTVPTTTVGHGGGNIGNGGGTVVGGGGGSVVGTGNGCFNPCQEVVVITVPSFCGDGVVDPGEQCDDGNDQNGDGCENDCTQTMGDSCHGDVDCFGWSMHFAHPLLSDAIIELYDASNTILLGQGFAPQNNNPSTTVTGTRLVMPQPGSQINRQIQYMGGIKTLTSTMPTDCYSCGNGILDPGEECDGAAGGCGNGLVCNTAVCLCVSEPNNGVCGTTNGDIIYDLDDNGDALNENSPGLCLFGTVTGFAYSTITNQRTWQCTGQSGGENAICSAQELFCGNGTIDANSIEMCDDGNTVNGDGCSSVCEIEAVQCPDPITNFTVNYPVAPAVNVIQNAVLTLSGTVGGNVNSVVVVVGSQMYPATVVNGVREVTVSLPVGLSNIRVKAMHSSGDMACNGVLDLIFDVQVPYCGDGIVQSGEECDDGNQNNDDYCSSTCTLNEVSTCYDLIVTTTIQNAPTNLTYSCLGSGSDVNVQLFSSTGALLAESVTSQGSFFVTSPDAYTIVCSYQAQTSEGCQETVEIGGYCEDLVATLSTGHTYEFTCSGVGDNYVLVIKDAQQNIVTTVTATGDFTYSHTFTGNGSYTATCFVDGMSNTTCADTSSNTFSTQSTTNAPIVVQNSAHTKVIHVQSADDADISTLLQQQAVAKQVEHQLLLPSVLLTISPQNDEPSVVMQSFYKDIQQIAELIDQQVVSNCYNTCLETITITDPDVPVCTLVTDPETTIKNGSSLTVTGTCLYTGMQGVPSIDCGNGQVISGATGTCVYTGKNSRTMGCMLDAQAVSGCNQLVKLSSGGGGSSILCGNGVIDPGEHCDDGNTVNGDSCPASCRKGGGTPSSITCGNGKIDPGEVCDDGIKNGLKSVCTTSCTLKGITPVVQGDTVPKCSFIDPPSIQLGELLPYWWEVEDDQDIVPVASCGAGSEGKIPEDSLRCYFTVEAPDGTKYKLDELCTSKKLMNVGRYNDLQQDLGMTLSSQRGQSYVDTSTWSSKVYGEYTISLDKITYAVCTETAAASATQPASYAMAYNQSYEGRVCQFNFAVTTPYLVQKGTALSSLADDVQKLKNFLRIDGRTILDVSDIVLLEKTSVSDTFATMKKAVYEATDKAVQKLDVSHPLGALDSGFRKVPNQELYVIDNGFTIRHYGSIAGFNGGKPTTIVVRGAVGVTIAGSLPGNVLLIAPEGTVTFVNEDCDMTDKIEATIVAAKINAKLAVDNANRSTKNSEWCTDGKLVVRGVLISEQQGSIEGMRTTRRSTLNDWFSGESSKSEHIYAGASLRIEARPGTWSAQPPLAMNNSLLFRTQSHGSAEEEVIVLLPLELLEVLLPLFH